MTVDASDADDRTADETRRLVRERQELMLQQQRIREEIDSVERVEAEELAYSVEGTEQKARLSAIVIFADTDFGHSCPHCLQVLPPNASAPSTEEIQADFSRISKQIDTVTRVAPRVETALAELKERLQVLRSRIAKHRAEVKQSVAWTISSANSRI